MMEAAGIQKGDRIAVCGRNSAHWAVTFLATLTYGAVIVPILHEFNEEQIHNIVNHSDSKLLFVGDFVAKTIQPEAMQPAAPEVPTEVPAAPAPMINTFFFGSKISPLLAFNMSSLRYK